MISSYQLAEKCGVSRGTVVRALTGKGRIAPKTKARILAAAEKYGYVAHPAVEETIHGTSHVVGAVIPETAGSLLMAVLREATLALRAKGLSLLIGQADDQGGYDALIREFASRRVKALLVVTPVWKLQIPKPIRDHLRIATYPARLSYRNLPEVPHNPQAVSRMQVDYCTARGHKRIAYITHPAGLSMLKERLSGYRSAMKARGLTPHVVVFDSEKVLDGVAPMPPELFEAVLNRGKTTAVASYSSGMVISFMQACAARGIDVPQQVSVIGRDLSPEFMGSFPHLTAVMTDRAATGAAFAEWAQTGVMPKFDAPCFVHEGTTVRSLK